MLTRSKEVINGLSKEFVSQLEAKYEKLPKKIKYSFDVARRNPDPQKTGGDVIYPSWWELQPVTFFVKDPGDKQSHKIGLVTEEDSEGIPIGFKRIVLKERDRGIKTLNKDEHDSFDTFCYLYLHPANREGEYRDENVPGLFKLVDESKEATGKSQKRKLKTDAMFVADNMTTQDEKDMASAKGWDEDMDETVLHEKIGEFAENDPEGFKVFVESANMEYRAVVKRAEANKIIDWQPAEYKYVWSTSKETIVAFGRQDGMDRLEKMAEWLMNKKDTYDKLKGLLKAAKVYVS